MSVRSYLICVALLGIWPLRVGTAGNPDPTMSEIASQYRTIRDLTLDSTKVLEINGFSISRDVGEFDFEHGRIYFFQPVAGRVIAAYFDGTATFRLSTDNKIERQQLVMLGGREIVELNFEQAMFLFSDSTYDQISHIHDVTSISIPDTVRDIVRTFRSKIRDRFVWNMDARLLADLADAEKGDFFCAFLECVDDKEMLYVIDPMDEEEVSLFRYEPIRFSKRADFETWYSSAPRWSSIKEKPEFDISQLKMDVEIGTDQKLMVNADMHFTCLCDRARIVPIKLEHVLRVEAAILDGADTCQIIQEDKNADAQLWIVFPYVLHRGKEYDLTLFYDGKGLIKDIGGDNFSIIGRTAWFPSFYTNAVDPRHFKMTFSIPKNLTLLGTGDLVREWTEENRVCSEWDSRIEHCVAGFNYGKFLAATQQSSRAEITCYTNEKLSDALLTIRMILEENPYLEAELMLMPQELTTDGIGKNAAIECRNAYEVYNHFYGDIPIRKINVSQQPQVSFAASWPTLIFLPFTAFYDESVRQRLFEPAIGLRKYGEWEFYHEGVASHEIAHQWWGHTVMIASYHDEWLNEGFATYSEALHLLVTKGVDDFKKYMTTLRHQIFSDAGRGMSLAELGPISLGDRLSSLEVPYGKHLIYVKGAYVLHMLRMMLFDYKKKSDEGFIKMMQDYVRTYAGKIATTEDFKRVVEKHFGRDMDWFFDQWVYGTEIPAYYFDYDVENAGDGYFLTIIGQQSNVSSNFEMPVPFIVNFKQGHAVVQMTMKGNETIGKKFHLRQEPLSIEANPWSAVLCTITE